MTTPTGFERLCTMFPVTNKRARVAYTGYIPMDFFVENEDMIREYVREAVGNDYRVYFLGPRPNRFPRPACTLRKNATHAMIYPRTNKHHFEFMDRLYNAARAS